MRTTLLAAVSAMFLLASCGSEEEENKITKDTKADVNMNIAAINQLNDLEKEKEAEEMEGKIVEFSGFVKEVKEPQHSAKPNKYYVSIVENMEDDKYDGVGCYTDEDVNSLVGKKVTAKGEFEFPGTAGLKNAVIYE